MSSQLKPQIFLDRYLVMASVAASAIAVYDIETRRVLRVFADIPQAQLLNDVNLTTDARHVIQVNNDGQYFIHEIASGRLALSGRVADNENIAYTPEGYYWSSYEGAHFVQFQFPGLPGAFPFRQFGGVVHRPDLVLAQLKPGALSVTKAGFNGTPLPRAGISRTGFERSYNNSYHRASGDVASWCPSLF